MELDPHLAYSIRSRGESRAWGEGGGGGGGPQLTDRAPLLSLSVLSVVPGRRRAGCRGSLRRLWSSWYASLSAPLSTPWPKVTPSASSRRSTRRARRSEGQLAITANHQLQKPRCFSKLPTTPFLISALPPRRYPTII